MMDNLLNWVSEGHLLVLNDLDILTEKTYSALGILDIVDVSNESKCCNYTIDFLSTTPLMFNLPKMSIKTRDDLKCFVLMNSSSAKPAAIFKESSDSSLPVAVLSQVGNGYCLILGFGLQSILSGFGYLKGIYENTISFYGEIEFVIRTNPINISDAFSPHLYPLEKDYTLLLQMDAIAENFYHNGFNVYYSNLLSSDYEHGGYYGSIE